MRRWKIFLAGPAVIAVLFIGATRASAQEPKPPVREYPPLIEGRGDQESDQQPTTNLQPDTRPLTGIQNTTLGSPEIRHSYWVPGFQYTNTSQNYALNAASSSGWSSNSYFTGNLSMLEAWSHSQLSMNYSAGGFLSTDSAQGNGYFHQFGLVQAFEWQRWQLQFLDQFSYLPETQFGFGGATNLGIPGIGGSLGSSLPGLQGNFVPNQSILTSIGSRYSNGFATQVVYALSPRGSITVAGSYGILRFVEAGNIDSDDVIANAGYEYALTKEDTLGVLYRFSAFHYAGYPQAMADHVFNFAYGRKITGRLALQLFGGPEVTTFRVPVANITDRVSGSGGASLSYAFSRGSVSLGYNHGVSGGSGVLIGSSADQLNISANRQLGRLWNVQGNFGYARNHGIATANTQNAQSYDAWLAGAGLSRPLGRNASFTFGYTARIQTSNQPACAAGKCSTNFTQHQISVGLQWHTRPFVLR